jgi:hypothetical protein
MSIIAVENFSVANLQNSSDTISLPEKSRGTSLYNNGTAGFSLLNFRTRIEQPELCEEIP